MRKIRAGRTTSGCGRGLVNVEQEDGVGARRAGADRLEATALYRGARIHEKTDCATRGMEENTKSPGKQEIHAGTRREIKS